MAIPEITAQQVALLIEMVQGLGAFSQATPDPKLDSAKDYEAAMEIVRDNEQLVILGLLKEITDTPTCKEKLVTMFAMTGRLFRIFEVTDITRRLFDGVNRTIQ
jgi:hypothetical protein